MKSKLSPLAEQLAEQGRNVPSDALEHLEAFQELVRSLNDGNPKASEIANETLRRVAELHKDDWDTYDRKLRFVYTMLTFIAQADVLGKRDYSADFVVSIDAKESFMRAVASLELLNSWRSSGEFRLASDDSDDSALWLSVQLAVLQTAVAPDFFLSSCLNACASRAAKPDVPVAPFPYFGNN